VYDVGKLQVTGKAMANAVEQHRTNVAHIANGEHAKVKCPGCGDGSSYDVGHTARARREDGHEQDVRLVPGVRFQAHLPRAEDQAAAAPSKLAKTDDASQVDVAKSVDSSETAVQGDTDGGGEGKAWCGQCKHYCRKVEDGKCPTCGSSVRVKKFAERLPDVVKRLRERAGV
jgi:endogenous inhibitor of DNA gyrase (YacG/DUF329 family)